AERRPRRVGRGHAALERLGGDPVSVRPRDDELARRRPRVIEDVERGRARSGLAAGPDGGRRRGLLRRRSRLRGRRRRGLGRLLRVVGGRAGIVLGLRLLVLGVLLQDAHAPRLGARPRTGARRVGAALLLLGVLGELLLEVVDEDLLPRLLEEAAAVRRAPGERGAALGRVRVGARHGELLAGSERLLGRRDLALRLRERVLLLLVGLRSGRGRIAALLARRAH